MLPLADLNPPQREAVTTVDGPVLVLAGAGSGKTRVITYRIAHLLERGVPPERILAVSFTNKAADEMRERVARLVGAEATRQLTLSTFHALGLQILKREREALGFPTGFTIYDAADQLGVVREALRDIRVDDRRFDAKAVLFRISRWKNAFVGPGEARVEDGDYDRVAAQVYPRYERALRAFHALDFDDLIVTTVRLLDGDEAVRERWSSRFSHVMIDEYQDTNRSQLLLVRHLAARHGNLCVVGDDDQSIYAWRGAESGNILEFDRHFPGAKVVTLEENYRSTPIILDAANAVIAHNARRRPKRLFTTRPPGEKIHLVVAPDAEEEARFVADEIGLLRLRHRLRLRDCAVLYRSNAQARPLEEALRTSGLAYRMIGGQAFYERKEVKDAIAYVKTALYPRDEIALRRIVNYPSRGIGDTSLERCAAWATERKATLWQSLERAAEVAGLTPQARAAIDAFTALLLRHRSGLAAGHDLAGKARLLLEEARLFDDLTAAGGSPTAIQRRLENLEGFLSALDDWQRRNPDGDIKDYLHRLSLSANDDDADTDGRGRDQLTMVTLHGAKGLEFPVVFIVGVEEDLLPHRRSIAPQATDLAGSGDDLAEERRLLYVGITRARERLYLSRARVRGNRRTLEKRSPSRFLAEIPEALCEARDLEVPGGDPEDLEAVADHCLAELHKLLG